MDPLVASMVGRLAGEAVKKSFTSVTGSKTALPEWSEEADHTGGFEVLDPKNGETLAILTQDQCQQVSEFLESPDCQSITQFLLIAKFACRTEGSFKDISEDFGDAFQDLAYDYCDSRNYNWGNLAFHLWLLLLDYVESVFPSDDLSSFVTAEEQRRITAYLGVTQKISGKTKPANVAFRDLVDIAGDSGRFETARCSLHDIRAASVQFYSEVNLAHALGHMQESFRFERGVLYVNRSLRDHNTDEKVTDEFLSAPTSRPRCVVIGNPGVGKSTMVQHIVHKLSSGSSPTGHDFAPLVVQCKEFSHSSSSTFILDSITRSLRENLQLDIDGRVVQDLLTLGRAFVVFDGIDEIIDIGRRQQMVKAVEAFAFRYPLAPILVTARRIGYKKAPLSTGEFKLFELDDYTDEQVDEYTQKWFTATSRTEDERQAFLRESRSIPDVCANPLMLSLLCALYRARGYIPHNRRDVYKSCADLLFQRWDSMRQIEQPMDHRHYGTRLMQGLALFFYRSQSAQGGVEERQLRTLIRTFFTDTASVEPDEATRRAQAFLDFCADRAWLLTSQGISDRGERLFGFTHRTFMEYFSAEEIVRRAHSLTEVVDEVAKAHERDASSVLADVIVQCADEKYDRGAQLIVEGLLEKTRSLGKTQASKYINLSLRILNAAPVPKRTTDAIFLALFAYWERVQTLETKSSAAAVFDLYRDPRNRLRGLLLENMEEGDWRYAEAVVRRWARFLVSGESRVFDSAWEDHIKEIAEILYRAHRPSDEASQAYAVSRGLISINEARLGKAPGWLMCLHGWDTWEPGLLPLSIARIVWTGEGGETDRKILSWAASQDLGKWRVSQPPSLDAVFQEMSRYLFELSAERLSAVDVEHPKIREILLWISCALYEISSPSLHAFHDVLNGIYHRGWFGRVASTRDYFTMPGAELSGRPRPFTPQEIIRESKSLKLPTWFGRWCRGKLHLIPADLQAQ